MAKTDRRAIYALSVLTFINLFNYVDRFVLSAVVEAIKADLGLTDAQIGLVGSGFIVVYSLTSPVFGSLGDARRRPPLIAMGVAIWSLATAFAGFARGFLSLFVARAAVGVGEAAYGTIAPALLADQFPVEKRGRVLAVFFSAIPIGSAAGYILGGLADAAFGWRAAFWIAGFPGIFLSILVWFVYDPPRGHSDAPAGAAAASAGEESDGGGARPRLHWTRAYLQLLAHRQYVLAVLGYGAYTFALGGLAFWMPAFLERVRGMERAEATVTFGAIAVGTGFVGTFVGGWLGDRFLERTRQSYLWVSGIATLVAAPATYVALAHPSKPVYLTAIVIAEVLIFMCTGPVNSAIVNLVSPGQRATAVGLSVFAMHLFGDIPSPYLIGQISEATSLSQAFLIVPVAVLVAGMIWTYAAWRGDRTA